MTSGKAGGMCDSPLSEEILNQVTALHFTDPPFDFYPMIETGITAIIVQ